MLLLPFQVKCVFLKIILKTYPQDFIFLFIYFKSLLFLPFHDEIGSDGGFLGSFKRPSGNRRPFGGTVPIHPSSVIQISSSGKCKVWLSSLKE